MTVSIDGIWAQQVLTDKDLPALAKVFACALSILGPQYAESSGLAAIGKMVGMSPEDVNRSCNRLAARQHIRMVGNAMLMVIQEQEQSQSQPH